MAFFYKVSSSVLVIFIVAPHGLLAQFRGGNNDGVSFNVASNQPLGRNIFLGGNDDGFETALAGNQPMGRNVFLGGINDGFNFSTGLNQPFGRNIFLGGNDDGIDVTLASNQPLGRNIFLGGNDDGFDLGIAGSQPLGRNVYTGGANDGWAVAFAVNVPLPITLLDFNGRWQENDGLLSWKTSSETNSAHFELERSFDSRNFTSIQRIAAAGQSSTEKSYQYRDINLKKQLPAGVTTVYYRLRSVDKNGDATYSGIVLLKATNLNEIEYAVFPNPAKDFVTITATGLPAVEGTYIRLADAGGKVLVLQKMTTSRQQVPVSAYTNGTYFLQLVTAEKVVYTQKIIIRK